MNLGTATTLSDGKLTYHQTIVCEALPNGRTRLDSGGDALLAERARASVSEMGE